MIGIRKQRHLAILLRVYGFISSLLLFPKRLAVSYELFYVRRQSRCQNIHVLQMERNEYNFWSLLLTFCEQRVSQAHRTVTLQLRFIITHFKGPIIFIGYTENLLDWSIQMTKYHVLGQEKEFVLPRFSL